MPSNRNAPCREDHLLVHQFVRVSRRVAPFLLGAALGMAVLPGLAQVAAAQAGTVSGTVVDAKTGRPLAEAVLVVEGSPSLGARTSGRGDFRLTGVPGQSSRIRVT